MSRLNAFCNFTDGSWKFEYHPERVHEVDVAIGFDLLNFKDLSFGYSFNGRDCTFPKDEVTIHASYEHYVHVERNPVGSGEDITFSFWATNNGETISDSYTISIPKPTQPHLSWTWDESIKNWVPPVAQPVDESKTWHWNEDKAEWVGFDRLVVVQYID